MSNADSSGSKLPLEFIPAGTRGLSIACGPAPTARKRCLSPPLIKKEPPSQVELPVAVAAQMPRPDLPERLLKMHARTALAAEFTHASERGARAGDLPTSICAVLLVPGP